MAVTYAIDTLDNFLREELPSVINESLPDIAPVYKYIDQTNFNVQRKGIGRDWKVIHLYTTGLAGLIQNADPQGAAMYDNQYHPQSRVINTGIDIFPSATAAPHTASLRRDLTLQMTTGNFSIPITWLSGDALSSSQIQQVVRDIKAVGQLRALTEAQSFFMPSDNTLCRINDYVSTNEATGRVTFTVAAGSGRTQFFRIGMMVDVLDHSGSGSSATPLFGTDTDGTDVKNYDNDQSTYHPLIVTDVDYFSGVISIATVNEESLAAANMAGDAIEDDDFVVLRGCGATDGREQRTWGLEDWMKGSGQIMGGSASDQVLDLDTYSQFKSKVVSVSGPLTDGVMNGYIGGFLDAFPGASIDTIITTMGVTLKYIEQPGLYNNRMFYDRTGKALDVKGGWDDVTYVFNGRNLRWMVSPMAITGKLYALKLNGGNIKRYVPPKVGGTDNRVGDEIEFLATLAGHSNVFKIAHASSGASQAVLEAPFWQYCLICPIDVKGVVLTDLTEATMS
jgi:hypothetical protein